MVYMKTFDAPLSVRCCFKLALGTVLAHFVPNSQIRALLQMPTSMPCACECSPIVLTPRASRQPAPQTQTEATSGVSSARAAKPAIAQQPQRHSAGSVAGSSKANTDFSSQDLPIAAAKPGQKYYDPSVAYSVRFCSHS